MAWRGDLPPIPTSLQAPRAGMDTYNNRGGTDRTPERWQSSQQPLNIKSTLVIPLGPDGYSGDLSLYPVTGLVRRWLRIR